MALIIRIQGFKDWKMGLITTEELLAGKVYAEPPALREMWEQIVARAKGDWANIAHHPHCCCDKCAPTEEDRHKRIELHNNALDINGRQQHSIQCCCNQCLDDMERGMLEYENLAPSDCEE